MKTVTTLISTVVLTLLCFSAVLYSSCSKIECLGKTCQHGGACSKGKCTCPGNYEGSNCENGINKRFEGVYTGTSDCGGAGTQVYLVASSTDPVKLTFQSNFPSSVYMTVDGNSITIPYQTYYDSGDQMAVQGTGNLNGNTISIYLSAADLTTGDYQTCTITATK